LRELSEKSTIYFSNRQVTFQIDWISSQKENFIVRNCQIESKICQLFFSVFYQPKTEIGKLTKNFPKTFYVINLIVEFNILSKSGLGIEIGQLCAIKKYILFGAMIQLLSHRKTSEIATFRKNLKIFQDPIFSLFFHLKFHF
jgi:hypothetical protein